MRISDWSSDVCSSDLATPTIHAICHSVREYGRAVGLKSASAVAEYLRKEAPYPLIAKPIRGIFSQDVWLLEGYDPAADRLVTTGSSFTPEEFAAHRSEEHTSELQSLMRISYAVFCLKKKTTTTQQHN